MNFTLYDINVSVPHRFWTIASSVASKFNSIPKFLSKRKIKSGIVKGINQRLSNSYFVTEGVLKNLSENQLKKDTELISFHKSTEKALNHFSFIYTNLEKMDFFNNSQTKELCENILTNFYKIESQLRMVVYSDAPSIPEDKELIEIASHFTMSSLS